MQKFKRIFRRLTVKAPDLLDFRHYKCVRSSAKRTGRLYPTRNPWYSFSEAESTSGHMVLSEGTTEKFKVTPLGIDPGTVRLVAQRLNHYATPGPSLMMSRSILLRMRNVTDKRCRENQNIFLANCARIREFKCDWTERRQKVCRLEEELDKNAVCHEVQLVQRISCQGSSGWAWRLQHRRANYSKCEISR